jgi:DNA-3-methyladenine glycosylase II
MMTAYHTELIPRSPFSFDLTCQAIAAHTGGQVALDTYEDGVLRRVLSQDGRALLVSARSEGSVDRPRLMVEVWGDAVKPDDAEWASGWVRHILATDEDLAAFYNAVQGDPVLGKVLARLHGLSPGRAATVFEALVLSIIGQQIAATVARLIRTDLLQAYGTLVRHDGATYYGFPTAETLLAAGLDGLRKLRLSQRKAEYILGICERVVAGELDLEGLRSLTRDDIVEGLVRLRGIGPWTAEWVLGRALGRLDAFPAGDLALQRTLSRLYSDGRSLSEKETADIGRRWEGHQGLVVTYLFAALRLRLLDDILA